jgi:hypothetical protein
MPWRCTGSGGITPCILYLGIRQKWLVSFRLRPLFTQGESLLEQIGCEAWMDLRALLGTWWWRENPCPYWEMNPGRPGHSLVIILTELSWLLCEVLTSNLGGQGSISPSTTTNGGRAINIISSSRRGCQFTIVKTLIIRGMQTNIQIFIYLFTVYLPTLSVAQTI